MTASANARTVNDMEIVAITDDDDSIRKALLKPHLSGPAPLEKRVLPGDPARFQLKGLRNLLPYRCLTAILTAKALNVDGQRQSERIFNSRKDRRFTAQRTSADNSQCNS
jgi:hypothetical protein